MMTKRGWSSSQIKKNCNRQRNSILWNTDREYPRGRRLFVYENIWRFLADSNGNRRDKHAYIGHSFSRAFFLGWRSFNFDLKMSLFPAIISIFSPLGSGISLSWVDLPGSNESSELNLLYGEKMGHFVPSMTHQIENRNFDSTIDSAKIPKLQRPLTQKHLLW